MGEGFLLSLFLQVKGRGRTLYVYLKTNSQDHIRLVTLNIKRPLLLMLLLNFMGVFERKQPSVLLNPNMRSSSASNTWMKSIATIWFRKWVNLKACHSFLVSPIESAEARWRRRKKERKSQCGSFIIKFKFGDDGLLHRMPLKSG